MEVTLVDNQTIARRLSNHAAELYAANGDFFRIRAYRWAAERVRSLARPLEDVLEKEGRRGLAALPGIGSHLAYTIEELIRTGELRTWEERRSLEPQRHGDTEKKARKGRKADQAVPETSLSGK
jgi:DNA polymerase/3'-5' exonuclease PolX